MRHIAYQIIAVGLRRQPVGASGSARGTLPRTVHELVELAGEDRVQVAERTRHRCRAIDVRLALERDSLPEHLEHADLTGSIAIVLGNEAAGLPGELASNLDGQISIPVEPPAESLNVGMAGTVIAFEAARQRRAAR